MVQTRKLDLTSVEVLTLIYILITTVMIAVYWNGLTNPVGMIGLRLLAIGIMIVTNLTTRHWALIRQNPRCMLALRSLPVMALLIWWYPETYDFCSQLPYKDHIFAAIDQRLFGCQPSMEFERMLPQTLWSEAFNMGYYAYYYMMGAVIIYYLVKKTAEYDRATFIFLGSFFIFYLVFEFLPVAGPQFYFKALQDIYGTEGIPDNVFPDIGNYFRTHEAMMLPEVKGIFSQLVISAQEFGEHPTAAFPSSHVGMSTVTMLLAWRSGNRLLFLILLPFYVLLCCATVYIRAHYLIDSICGLAFAVLCFYLTDWIYQHRSVR